MKQGRSVAAHTALSGAEDSRSLWPRTGSALSRLQEVGGALWKASQGHPRRIAFILGINYWCSQGSLQCLIGFFFKGTEGQVNNNNLKK